MSWNWTATIDAPKNAKNTDITLVELQVQEYCPHGTAAECRLRASQCGSAEVCGRLHFKKILQKHTDETLGDCSFLNTCFHMDTCKYVHYQVDIRSVFKTSRCRSTLFSIPLYGASYTCYINLQP